MNELKAIGEYFRADGRLLKKRAAALAKYTEEVVADIGNTVIYDGWEAKLATYTNPDMGRSRTTRLLTQSRTRQCLITISEHECSWFSDSEFTIAA